MDTYGYNYGFCHGPMGQAHGPKDGGGGSGPCPMGPWVRVPGPWGPAAIFGPMGLAHGPIGESIYLFICIHICPYVSIYTCIVVGHVHIYSGLPRSGARSHCVAFAIPTLVRPFPVKT